MSSCGSDTISILPKIRVTLILIRVGNLCPLCSYSRKFLVTPLRVGVTTALDWGLSLNPYFWATCSFSCCSSHMGRGLAAGTLIHSGFRQHKSNQLKLFGSRTASLLSAQLTETATPQLEAFACCQFACPQYEEVTQPPAMVTALFFTSPSQKT